MASDIVEELREADNLCPGDFPPMHLFNEAADEIAALRSRIAELEEAERDALSAAEVHARHHREGRERIAELEAALRRLIDAPRYPCDELHEAFRHAEKVAP